MKLIIARPEPYASELKNLFEQKGHTVILSPAVAYGLPDAFDASKAKLQAIQANDYLIFISQQAVKGLLELIPDIPKASKIFAVGKSTANALLKQGVSDVYFPSRKANSENLLALPELETVAGQRIVIINGGPGRQQLSQVLTERGAYVETVASYSRLGLKGDLHLLLEAWRSGVDCVVLTSLEVAQAFEAQLGEHKTLLQDTMVTTMSDEMEDWAAARGIKKTIRLHSGANLAIVTDIEEMKPHDPVERASNKESRK